MRKLRGFFLVFAILGTVFAQASEPLCCAGMAQHSAIGLVRKLNRAFEQGDAAAFSAHARCPFGVGKHETDNIRSVPPRVFADRFLNEVTTLDLTLTKGDVGSTYPEEARRIFLYVRSGQRRAELYVDRKPKEFGSHRHIFLLERNSDGWPFRGYGTTDDDLLERLRRGYPAVLMQARRTVK